MLPAAMGKKCKKSSNRPNLKKAGRLAVETAINSSLRIGPLPLFSRSAACEKVGMAGCNIFWHKVTKRQARALHKFTCYRPNPLRLQAHRSQSWPERGCVPAFALSATQLTPLIHPHKSGFLSLLWDFSPNQEKSPACSCRGGPVYKYPRLLREIYTEFYRRRPLVAASTNEDFIYVFFWLDAGFFMTANTRLFAKKIKGRESLLKRFPSLQGALQRTSLQ